MSKSKIKCIGILTSGGDSPGMNCAIRSVVRTSIAEGIQVFGISRGYTGLLNNDIIELTTSSVGNIIQRGGTVLLSSRSPEFLKKTVRKKAAQILEDRGIEALIVIGGDGSFKGAAALGAEHSLPIIGIPGTIDNDISATDYTLGFDTAVETAIDAVDKIRDTAASSDRTFFIEVMGATSSSIAVKVGICTGAENILTTSDKINYEKISNDIRRGLRRGKNSSIIIVAEGKKPGRSYQISETLKEVHGIDSRVCVLGHIQRGGSPSANDRFYGSLMGKLAVESILEEKKFHAIVVQGDKVTCVPLSDCMSKSDHVMKDYLGVAESLSV